MSADVPSGAAGKATGKKGFQGAVFDLDGTILDSMWVWTQVDRDFLGNRGLTVPHDYERAIATLGFRAAADYTVRRFSLPEAVEAVMQEWQDMAAQQYAQHVGLKAGAAAYLRHLQAAGVRVAAATASIPLYYRPALERAGVYGAFDAFATVDEVGRGKAFPDVFLCAAAKIGVPVSGCVVFEDILAAVQTAKSAGFYTVAVLDAASASDHENLTATADAAIRDFNELL